jgi:plasmid stability protein
MTIRALDDELIKRERHADAQHLRPQRAPSRP